jgi:hypothetical protein
LQRLQGGGIIMRIGHADWTRGLDTRIGHAETLRTPHREVNPSTPKRPRSSY